MAPPASALGRLQRLQMLFEGRFLDGPRSAERQNNEEFPFSSPSLVKVYTAEPERAFSSAEATPGSSSSSSGSATKNGDL